MSYLRETMWIRSYNSQVIIDYQKLCSQYYLTGKTGAEEDKKDIFHVRLHSPTVETSDIGKTSLLSV